MANKAISDNDLMMMSDSQLSDYSIGDVPVECTETNKLYSYLLQHPQFLLSMQPRMIEDVESDDDFDDFDNATFEHESFMMTSVHNISVNQQGSSQKIPSSQYETQRSQ